MRLLPARNYNFGSTQFAQALEKNALAGDGRTVYADNGIPDVDTAKLRYAPTSCCRKVHTNLHNHLSIFIYRYSYILLG